ncbi:MAG: hypothetical protein IPF58_15365 [Saprospirales bacterium]|nr:hypothetical protein [Saprospirales bacterium]
MQNLNEQQTSKINVDSLKPIALHVEIGMDSMSEKKSALFIQPNMHDDFVNIVKIDIKRILVKRWINRITASFALGLIAML